jgi:hypothetical protein
MIDDVGTLIPFLRRCFDEDELNPDGWPAERLRADLDAKRRILTAYEEVQAKFTAALLNVDNPDPAKTDVLTGQVLGLGTAIRALASAYQGRPWP